MTKKLLALLLVAVWLVCAGCVPVCRCGLRRHELPWL